MTPGETIRHLRQARNLTQYELGQLVGVRPQSVAQWESGETTPRWTTLRSLDQTLGGGGEVLRVQGAPFTTPSSAEVVAQLLQLLDEHVMEIAALKELCGGHSHRIASLEKLLKRQIQLDELQAGLDGVEDGNHAEEA